MQSVSEIRHHISAVEQTRKITSAMQMVSSARMKKFAVQMCIRDSCNPSYHGLSEKV